MSDRVKGITIEIDGNTTKLSKALEGVNKDIKSTQQQLKDVEKLLKLDPGNMDLLRQKQQLYTDAVSATKEKLQTLKDALSQMDASGVDKTSEQYMSLQREIISCTDELDKLEKAARNSNATLQKVSQTAKSVADASGKVASATKGLSTAAGGALAGIAGLGIKAAASADDLNTLAKQTGLSTETLQKFQYASDLIDVSMTDLTGSVKKLKKNLTSNSKEVVETWDRLGVSLRDSNGELRDIESIYFEAVEALGKIGNETERDTVAMTLFGKSADSLAGILDDGGAALKELGKEAEDRGVIISQEDLDKANELNDTLDGLKATLTGSLGQAAAQIAESFAPIMEQVAGWLTVIAEKIANMNPKFLEVTAIVLGIIAAISPVASLISGIATAIGVITPIIATVNAVIAANPIVLIITAIVAAIGLLVAAGVAIAKNWDEIKAKAQELWGNLTEKFTQIKDNIVGAWENVKEKVSGAFENIKESAKEKFNALKENTSQVMDAVKQHVAQRLGNMKQAFEENGGGFKGAMAAAWTGIKDHFSEGFNVLDKLTGGKLSEIKDAFIQKFKDIIESAKNWGRDIIENLVSGIKEKISRVKDAVGDIANTIKDFLGFSEPEKGPLSNFHTFMPDMIDLMSKGLKDGARKIENPLNTLAQKLVPDTQSIDVNLNDSSMTTKLDNINDSLLKNGTVAVSVYLQGDANGIFRVVQQQTHDIFERTGRNPLLV